MPDAVYLERSVSALKSDATVHLGNYFGALKGSLEGQDLYPRNNFLFIADRHYLVDFDADVNLKLQNKNLIRDFIALGFNPERTVIYRQSDIRELFSLMWLLSCKTPARELIDRLSGNVDPSLARLLYPQLMATDILGLRASRIYVGHDEQRHVTYCEEVANFVNSAAKRTLLPLPARGDFPSEVRVPGVDGKPMSSTNKNVISVFESERSLNRCFRQIRVEKVRKHEPLVPETDICFQLFSLMAGPDEIEDVRSTYRSAKIGEDDARNLVKQQFEKTFSEARRRRADLSLSDDEVEEILRLGQQRVRREMRNTIASLQDALYPDIGRKSYDFS
ncbi:hypothetical protein AAFG07_33395 [Bradyrhizobium sp. B097]|uniref:hypothetical protein n=1 Tax=Bradyrhizobium sp. B097 TaxID=3140244 RepID=UPI0031840E17